MAGSLHDWQRKQPFLILNNEECSAKAVRLRIKQVIDIKDLLVGGLALLDPDESIPCDIIFTSGHTVKCASPVQLVSQTPSRMLAMMSVSLFDSKPGASVRMRTIQMQPARIRIVSWCLTLRSLNTMASISLLLLARSLSMATL